jgi:hypothetical protein
MERFLKLLEVKTINSLKVILMKSILFIAFLAIAAIGCDTPENTTGSDTSAPPTTTDSTMTTPSTTDTVTTMPADTATMPTQPTDTTTTTP